MTGTLAQLAHEIFRDVDNNNIDAVRARIAPDCAFAAPGMAGDRDAGLAFMQVFLDAFPGITHSVTSATEQDGRIAIELRIQGMHTKPLLSPAGAIPATGKPVDMTACNVWTVANGLITSYNVYFDQASMMAQLGLM